MRFAAEYSYVFALYNSNQKSEATRLIQLISSGIQLFTGSWSESYWHLCALSSYDQVGLFNFAVQDFVGMTHVIDVTSHLHVLLNYLLGSDNPQLTNFCIVMA